VKGCCHFALKELFCKTDQAAPGQPECLGRLVKRQALEQQLPQLGVFFMIHAPEDYQNKINEMGQFSQVFHKR
jgi:hypothetical protein